MKTKIEVPASVQSDMNRWRADGCWAPVPKAYREFHEKLATAELERLQKDHNITVHRTFQQDQGWFDGMVVVWAIVEERSGRLVKLSWHDGNQEFFEHGAGSWPYRPNEKKS